MQSVDVVYLQSMWLPKWVLVKVGTIYIIPQRRELYIQGRIHREDRIWSNFEAFVEF